MHGAVPSEVLFPPDLQRIDRSEAPPAPRPHTHEQFSTREWQVPAEITPEQLSEELSRPGLLRAKGWAMTTEGERLVQVVGRRIELTPGAPPEPALLGRIVLIERAEES